MLLGSNVDNYDVKAPDIEPESVGFVATLTLKVIDRKGKVKRRLALRSHSPTYNFYNVLAMFGSLSANFTNTDGSTWNTTKMTQLNVNSLAIVIGSGVSNSPLTQTSLVAPIVNGSGSGELLYGNLNVSSSPSVSGSSMSLSIYNTFTNASNTTVTVTEVGVVVTYYPCYYADGCYNYNVLVWYDTIPAVYVAPGDTLVVTYTFTINP